MFVLGCVAAGLSLRLDPFAVLPAPIAAAIGSVPSTLWIYGVTSASWRDAALTGVPTGIGLALGTYL